MLKKVLKRMLEILMTLLFSTVVIFLLVHLAPGDPVLALYGREAELAAGSSQEFEARMNEKRSELGLDDSLPVQYARWLKRLAGFNLGESIRTGKPVADEIRARLPATIVLAAASLLIQIVLSLVFGIISALNAKKAADSIVRFICVFFASVPGFVIGLGLLSLCAVKLGIYKLGGGVSFRQIWPPAFTIALGLAPQTIRVTRASMLTEFGQTYVLAERARGLGRLLVVKNAMKNSALPFVTALSFSFASLLGGSAVIESIFAWPGIGKYTLDSILVHDYPVIQGYALIMVILIICLNLIVDFLYTVFDPRLRNNRRTAADEKV